MVRDQKYSGTNNTSSKSILLPGVKFMNCPVQASLGILGRKWTLLILRSVEFLKIKRFNMILKSIPGLTPRVLSMRLNELEEHGFIKKTSDSIPNEVHWMLTEKGKDVLPILLRLVEFGSKWHIDMFFSDKKPRPKAKQIQLIACKMIRISSNH